MDIVPLNISPEHGTLTTIFKSCRNVFFCALTGKEYIKKNILNRDKNFIVFISGSLIDLLLKAGLSSNLKNHPFLFKHPSPIIENHCAPENDRPVKKLPQQVFNTAPPDFKAKFSAKQSKMEDLGFKFATS